MPNDRKTPKWSQKKVEKLIQLYAKEECLWNPYNENYKNKAKRQKAMEQICSQVCIEPQLFLKKVHNLRNQFNSEYKKLERCIEEAEMLGEKPNIVTASKWIHFDSLMFLKDVIIRSPGTPPAKRIILESNNVADVTDVTEYNEITEVEEDYDDPKIEEELQNLTSNEETLNVTGSKKLANLPASSLQLKKCTTDFNKTNTAQQTTTSAATSAVIELATVNSVVSLGTEKHLQSSAAVPQFDSSPQDQWSALGAFVESEMRNYRSDVSRRKLKRKIMQAMLEVAEEDELLG